MLHTNSITYDQSETRSCQSNSNEYYPTPHREQRTALTPGVGEEDTDIPAREYLLVESYHGPEAKQDNLNP